MTTTANIDALKIVQDLLRALSLDTLEEHYKQILRTRRRGLVYGLNACTFIVARSMAKTLVQQELARRR